MKVKSLLLLFVKHENNFRNFLLNVNIYAKYFFKVPF